MTITELENKIIHLSQCYYEGHPECSDTEFDGLLTYLQHANPNSPILSMTGYGYDPYKQVGEKEHHLYGDVIGISKKPRDVNDIPKDFFNTNIMISAKLDGLSMVCYFVNGKFTKALTRGRNGIGINRTDKIEKILNRELNIPTGFNFTGAIRGEVCISNNQWENMIEKGLIEKDNPSVNPRNVAAGIIGRDDINEDLNYLDLVFYKVVGFNDDNNSWNKIYKESILENKKYDVKFLRKFIKEEYIVDYIEDNGSQLNQNALETLYNRFNSIYTCDGCVITKSEKNISKLNDKYQNKIALENNEIAYKFEGEKVITTIENIRWKMSKGNKAIPVINVTPVELSGAIVQNASAYNAKYIYENDLDVGCQVELTRSGEVIPYITGIITTSNGTGVEKLNNMCCPFCGNKLEWQGVDLVCTNVECANRDEQNLKVWVRIIAPIEGMSEILNFKFFNELNIKSLEDLYNHSYRDLEFTGMNSNTHKGKFNLVLDKLFNQKIDFKDLLVALNIKMLGVKNADKLAHNDEFIALFEEFVEIQDIDLFVSKATPIITDCVGQAMAKNICSADGLTKLKNAKYVEHRINYEYDKKEELIPVVITGKLSVPRKEFETYLNENGYEVKGAITKEVKYLITDNPQSGSSKNKKADELGIEKITEEQIRNMIDFDKSSISSNDIL